MALEESADRGSSVRDDALRRRARRSPRARGSRATRRAPRSPARNAGQIFATLSSDQPGSALHATGAYFAGSDGAAGGGVGVASGGARGAPAAAAATGRRGARGGSAATISSARGQRRPIAWTSEAIGSSRWYGSSSKRWWRSLIAVGDRRLDHGADDAASRRANAGSRREIATSP